MYSSRIATYTHTHAHIHTHTHPRLPPPPPPPTHTQALDLSPDVLAQREVVHVDIAMDDLSSGEVISEMVSP